MPSTGEVETKHSFFRISFFLLMFFIRGLSRSLSNHFPGPAISFLVVLMFTFLTVNKCGGGEGGILLVIVVVKGKENNYEKI